MNIHISGSNGFLGQALIELLNSRCIPLVPWVRRVTGMPNEFVVPDYTDFEHITKGMSNCDVFVHLAAKVHQLSNHNPPSYDDYRLANTDITLLLAKAALKAGVKHFIYISSVKVNGESTVTPLVEGNPPSPSNPPSGSAATNCR